MIKIANDNVRHLRDYTPPPPDVEPVDEFSDYGRGGWLGGVFVAAGCFVFFVAIIVAVWPP